ncbi:transglutaminase-like domain-containing protein [Enhydrobacter sp.]|uniref:SirB1 family protein n=1 Tax=Enhydrobacter sp. TaxID=1894999 RepID=UPI0026224D30|nr:transglutaminase-like domain-containing protein [Enhydrobacter sp.]WIM11533.1 MAG: Protein sirB1 [Enhydrobacter sp.]
MTADPTGGRQDLDRLRALCAGDGSRIDLLEAALELGALRRDAPVDAAPFRQHVAAMAVDLADLVGRRGAVPEQLGEVIAVAYGYRGDSETYDDLQNADLARVIERRKGLPVALSILYLHVARAQGWQAEGLAFPAHFLIRVTIEGGRHILDPFHDGALRDATELRVLLRQVLGPQAELQPAHFDPVADRDVLLRLENNVRLRLAGQGDWLGAARSLDRMLAIAPDRAELLFEAGEINARLDKRRAAIAAFSRFLDLEGGQSDPALRRRASELLQELRRGLN